MKLLLGFSALLLCLYRAKALTDPLIVTSPLEVSNQTSALLTCNITDPQSPVVGSYWTKNGVVIPASKADSSDKSTALNLKKIDSHSGGRYECVFTSAQSLEFKGAIEVKTTPHVVASKRSEHGNENDKGVLVCVSHGYPLPTDWKWYILAGESQQRQLIANSSAKYEIRSTPEKTTLSIHNLDIKTDMGDYVCEGENGMGSAFDTIHLRVRSKLAALWPFLGIVAEVIVLVTIIFIYEKRRKPDEIPDDDDSGSAPLKSNAATNDKDKNIRQRNSN